MAIKISGFTDEISSSLDEQLRVAKSLGMEYICPRSINGENISAFTLRRFEEEVKPVLDEKGIKFSSIGSPIGKCDIDDEEAFEKQVKQLSELVKIAEVMHCRYIRIFSFRVAPVADYSVYSDKVISKLKKFKECVQGTDVVLLHENEKKIYGDTPERCLELFRALGDEHFKLAFDASNYIQCKCDPKAAYDMLKEHVVYYHVKDCSPEGVEVPLGMGGGNYKEMLADLVNSGYSGFMTLEPHTAKYSVLKNAFNVLAPIAALIPPVKYFHRVFRRIDKATGTKMFQGVSRETVFRWQHERLVAMLKETGAEF